MHSTDGIDICRIYRYRRDKTSNWEEEPAGQSSFHASATLPFNLGYTTWQLLARPQNSAENRLLTLLTFSGVQFFCTVQLWWVYHPNLLAKPLTLPGSGSPGPPPERHAGLASFVPRPRHARTLWRSSAALAAGDAARQPIRGRRAVGHGRVPLRTRGPGHLAACARAPRRGMAWTRQACACAGERN
jgi:hypothetical protein